MATQLHEIQAPPRESRRANLVFVHGLNPLGVLNSNHAFSTWGGSDAKSNFWPKWLAEDLPEVGVWVLEYDAAALGWLGNAMPLPDRAGNVLDCLFGAHLDAQPLAFIAHSLGGLVVKQVLKRAATLNLRDERASAQHTRAVVFLATPHTGADLASFVLLLRRVLRQTDALQDLVANSAELREQAEWYFNFAPPSGIRTRSYFEELATFGVRVVDATAANPNVIGESAVGIGKNHLEIAKLSSRDDQPYAAILRFLKEALAENPPLARRP